MILKKINTWLINFIILQLLFICVANGQGSTSSIGDRENLGVYGGIANDLTWLNSNNRIFGGIKSPATLFYSDDTCKTWHSAFSHDSLEYSLGNRGWGGGASRVLTNQMGWVLVHTGFLINNLSAAVVSYDEGNSFKTGVDPFLLEATIGLNRKVNSIDITDHFCYAGLGDFLIRFNDSFNFCEDQIILEIDTIPGIPIGSKIGWIAVSNDTSGLPIYYVVDQINGHGRLFKYNGNNNIELSAVPANNKVINVFTHPTQIFGDTVFVTSFDTIGLNFNLFRSLVGGIVGWTDITPVGGISKPLANADYSPSWTNQLTLSNGLRISFPGGLLSNDLGNTWQTPSPNLLDYGIATHPQNLNLIMGSNTVGVVRSDNGINGQFSNTSNIGFTNVNVNDFTDSKGIYYIATNQGLAYTKEYFNPLITDYNQWIQPNGLFPIPSVGTTQGITSVAIDPMDSLHVICGDNTGFYVTFNGPLNFSHINLPLWNNGTHLDYSVTDILFINSDTILAVTGCKFKRLNNLPIQPIGNIWRSTDGGLNWLIMTPFTPDTFQMGNCLTVRYDSSDVSIYAGSGYSNQLGSWVDGALWKSEDFGSTWSKVNDGPLLTADTLHQPIWDIDIDPYNGQIMYISANRIFARSVDAGLTYFITDIPNNTGRFTSALIDSVNTDSVTITAGRNIYKYSFQIDDANLIFKGYPGEFFTSSTLGSTIAGSDIGASSIKEAPTYFLDLKVYIEGPFSVSEMTTTLNSSGYLPLLQPFNIPPWNYEGTEKVISIPNADIVDWILIDLRKTNGDLSTATAETRFSRQAAFLMKNGTITDDDGISNPRFSIILDDSKGSDKVQGVVYSPSHVGIRSADSLSLADLDTFLYNFTLGPEQVWGGAIAHKEIVPGIWGMISGDGNHNNQINNLDKNDIWEEEFGNTGYYFGDFNRDGEVNIIDINDYWKPNAGKGNKIE